MVPVAFIIIFFLFRSFCSILIINKIIIFYKQFHFYLYYIYAYETSIYKTCTNVYHADRDSLPVSERVQFE